MPDALTVRPGHPVTYHNEPAITSRIEKEGTQHVWLVLVDGVIRRKGWTPAGRSDAAREAAKDVRELRALLSGDRTRNDEGQMWTVSPSAVRSALRKPVAGGGEDA